MNPKEKAKELVDRFDEFTTHYTWRDKNNNAIECALIAVDEIINQWEYIDVYLADGRGELNHNLKYWYEVKKQILAL